jgi:hypothetical protein
MPEGSLPPQKNTTTALAAAGGGFLGAAVAVLAVNAMSDSSPISSSTQEIDNSQQIAVAAQRPGAD